MDPAYLHIPDLTALAESVPADSILSRTFYDGEDVRGVLFAFAPGQELSEHTAARPAILHFISGEARLKLGDDVQRASAGTWVHMPAQLPHSIYAESQVVMLLLLVGGAA